MPSKWTEEKISMLMDLWQNGYSARQISEKLGNVSRNAVIGKANRLGLSAALKTQSKRHERTVDVSYMRSKYCQWPLGTPGSQKFSYCGKAIDPGYPYCSKHKDEAYRRKVTSLPTAESA